MSTIDDYIGSVLNHLPGSTPDRAAIATELRGHISERVAQGHPLREVLHQLGDPAVLAESYLSAVPLTSAPLGHRALAKIVDALLVVGAAIAIVVPAGWAASRLFEVPPPAAVPFVLGGCLIGAGLLLPLYTVIGEHSAGQTVGKRLLGLRVVRESGTRIGLGQAIVRQLPMFLQVFWIDVMFTLFTERKQRAFEMLSKTRTVLALDNPGSGR